MNKLDKNKMYFLEELTSEQKQKLLEKLIELDSTWEGESSKLQLFSSSYLYFADNYRIVGEWLVSEEMYFTSKETRNAKELFYTLENVQVDCRELSKDKIKEMANVFEINGYDYFEENKDYALEITGNNSYLHLYEGEIIIDTMVHGLTTITYYKFMELFAEPKNEVKYIAEKPNDFKQITDSIASLLQYKNEKYGNSALEPLNVFQGKCKVGQRLDDKLARVKNNTILQKNDVADLIGYLFLVCKENNWNNFDEFKD